jgi:3-oxoacyl-[acyl-carrier protein] reductase
MLLAGKNAVIHGAGGAIGGAVARAFAREGATVFLAGRTPAKLDAVANQVASTGGVAQTAQVDALDEEAVERHAEAVAEQAGSLDVSFNAVGLNNGEQGIPLVELPADDYLAPITGYARTHFLTAKAAARHMMRQGSGVIMPLSVPMARMPAASSGSFGMAGAAVESFTRQLAAELGPYGIRVVCLRPTGMPETAARLGSHTREVWGPRGRPPRRAAGAAPGHHRLGWHAAAPADGGRGRERGGVHGLGPLQRHDGDRRQRHPWRGGRLRTAARVR